MSKINPVVEKIVDKQFQLIKCPLRWSSLPEDGLIDVKVGSKKKKFPWWEVYKFETEDEWMKWRSWAEDQLRKEGMQNIEKEMNYIDLRWGMAYKTPKVVDKKEGDQLDMF